MSYQIDAINHLIRHRRSVFPAQFVPGKKADDGIIRQILVNATWAPNHHHTEPWHFVVFTGEGLKKLSDFQSELYKEESGDHFKPEKYQKLKKYPLLASHVVALCMKRSAGKRVPEIEEIEAVACAAQNLALSVEAYGLGGYWASGGITYSKKAKPFFGLGEEDKLLGFFYIGHVAVASPRSKRQPLEEKMVWVSE
ncbi:nitroreductase [Paraflavisolibacter sp. H34]|uniref:nitroreductase family protein n=1 Tax=Huijunlia imazamoxiresistens TaxID=3127457 RepID=UPI003019E987